MRNVSTWLVAASALSSVALSGVCQAAEKEHEASVFGSVTHIESSGAGNSTVANLNGSYGRLLTEQFLLSGDVTVFKASSVALYGFGVSGKYYFGTLSGAGAVTPYARAQIHLLRASGGGAPSGTGNTMGAFAGLDFGITESASVFAEVGYEREDSPGPGSSVNQTAINIGLAVRF